jgi:sigma-B regulation protein RsbU (phosphoserine phosphatase)
MLLRRRLLLLFVAIVAGVVVLGAVATVVIRQRDDAQARERKLSVALERVARLQTAYSDQETGERGVALTGQEAFLQPYTDGRTRAAALTRQLRASLDTGALREQLQRVQQAGTRWRRDGAEPQIALGREGRTQEAADAVANGTAKALFDRLRTRLGALATRTQAESDAAGRQLDRVRNRLTILFFAVAGLAIVGAVAAAFLIRRWVTVPIDTLSDEVRRVRGGALDSPIRIAGPPELAALAGDVDSMRGRIRQQLLESERSRQAVEQSAAVVLTLRSELEPDVGKIADGWTVAGTLRAAEGVVAGDCYDLFVTHDDDIALIVIDIAGHGATEGILALRCKEVLRTSLMAGAEPGDALDATADLLGDMGDEVFLTAFVAAIDTADGRVRYANAGHPPAMVVRADGTSELGPTGPLVGLLAPGWSTAETIIQPGDNLCAYTDGLIEVRNGDNEFFGPDRLVELLQGSRCDQAQAVVKHCMDEVEVFSPDGLRDDATIVVLCRTG